MAAEGESTGKSKQKKENRVGRDAGAVDNDGEFLADDLETIPTAVPKLGDGYQIGRAHV